MIRIDLDKWEEILITITRNKTRSLLTAFGVFWGIFMLIALMGGAKGLEEMMAENFKGFATNSAIFGTNRTSIAYKGFQKGRSWDLELNDINKIKKQVYEVDVVTPTVSNWNSKAVYEDKSSNCVIKGLYPEYEKIESQGITMGRFFNDVDVRDRRKVCTIGKKIYEQLFPNKENPLGKFIRIDGIYYQIIGMSQSVGQMSINGGIEQSIALPITTMQQAYNRGRKVDLICITAKSGHTATEVAEKVEAVIKQSHYIHPDDKQAIMMVNTEAMFSMVDNLFAGMRLLSWMVGLGTLLAGAIGVSNIMMVTVRERTSEIGIRRAIGARPKDILSQILSESMVLTTTAGMFGICFGVFILQMLEIGTSQSDTPGKFQISFWAAIGACALLMVLGMLAGLLPAYRAMGIKPIDAIRDE